MKAFESLLQIVLGRDDDSRAVAVRNPLRVMQSKDHLPRRNHTKRGLLLLFLETTRTPTT